MSYRTYIAASRAAYIAEVKAGISPQELRARTEVIGEAFVADYLGVKLASTNNQRGYDLVDPRGLSVSVKTITTSTGVGLDKNTLDRVVVAWIDTQEDQLGVVVVYDNWPSHACVPVSQLIYAAFLSNAKGLLPPSDEWRRRGL